MLAPLGRVVGFRWHDGKACVATLTFLDKATNTFGGIGHVVKITTSQSGEVLRWEHGEPVKSADKTVGSLNGKICDKLLGFTFTTTAHGVFGLLLDDVLCARPSMPVLPIDEVRTGKAVLMSDLSGTLEEYSISIASAEKHIKAVATDQRLVDVTGGIVHGMSGSPVVQDGCLVGAVCTGIGRQATIVPIHDILDCVGSPYRKR